MIVSGFAKPNIGYVLIKSSEKTQENISFGVEECVLIIRENVLIYKLIRKLKGQLFYVFKVVDESAKELFVFNELALNRLLEEDLVKSVGDCKNKLLKNNK